MKLILAADKNWAIGKDGNLLCHLPGDLKYFKERTTGKTVVMGRKTLESLPGSKPLPNRRNVILSRNTDYKPEGVEVVNSVDELMELLKNVESDDIMVIGGGQIYKELLPKCDTCYITKIYKEFQGDTFFVNLDEDQDFTVTWESDMNNEKGIEYKFFEYRRK